MSGLIDKRKRSREDDVSCESTPLSKRINNLHLSNFEEAQYNHHHQLQQQEPHHSVVNTSNHIHQFLSKDMLMPHHAATASSTSDSGNGVMKSMTDDDGDVANGNMYNPELNESDNPFYYNKNKLLHELHLERIKRCIV